MRTLWNQKLRTKVALVAVAPLALATLVACGGDDTPAAEPTTDDSSSVSDEPGATDEGDVDPAEFFASIASAMESATTAHVQLMTEGGQSLSAEGDLDFSQDPAAMRMTMTLPQLGEGIEMRMVDGTMYMQMPGMGDGKFIKFALDDPTNPLGDMTGQLDPRSQFSSMQDAVKSVTFVGAEDVDGEELQHYSVVLDGTKMPNQQGVTMPDEIAYEMWVDDDDLLRKVSFESAGTVITTTISDWGKDVQIRAPRPGQIMEMPTAP